MKSKKLVQLLLSTILIATIFFVTHEMETISSNEMERVETRGGGAISDSIYYSSCLHPGAGYGMEPLPQLPQLGSTEQVAVGSDLTLHIYVSDKKTWDYTIRIELLEGLSFVNYQDDPNVLQIKDGNGYRNASAEEYSAFIGTGFLNTTSPASQVNYTLRLKANGSSATHAKTRVIIGDRANNTANFDYVYDGNFEKKADPIIHYVNVYDGTTLIEQIELLESSVLSLPTLNKEGYDLIGYNTAADGSGEYYQGTEVFETMDLYAIYAKKQYTVQYYVDQQLYATRQVEHGENAEELIVSKEGYKFIGWNNSLENITNDCRVDAVFERLGSVDVPKQPSKPDQPSKTEVEKTQPKLPERLVMKDNKKIKITPPTTKKNESKISEKIAAKIQKKSSVDGSSIVKKEKNIVSSTNVKDTETKETVNEVTTIAASEPSDANMFAKLSPFLISGVGILALLLLHFLPKLRKK